MPVEITMPQLSDTMSEGTLVKWLKKEGDKVKAQEIIAEVETDKATMEMESFENGTMALRLLEEGGKVAVGGLMAVLAKSNEDPQEIRKQYQGRGTATGAVAAQPVAGPAVNSAGTVTASAVATAGTTATLMQHPASIEAASTGEIHDLADTLHGATREDIDTDPAHRRGVNGEDDSRVKASPLARRMAEEAGIDLTQLHGTGRGGRITQADVMTAQQTGLRRSTGAKPAPMTQPALKAAELPPLRTAGHQQVIPFTKMRSAIAAALQKSSSTIPHYYEKVDIDLDDVMTLREAMNQRLESQNIRLSLSDFIMKAVAFALTQNPVLNARFDAEKNEVTRYSDVNLGTAVAVPDGLIVPVLHGVNRMGLREIRMRSSDLIARARAQRLRREEQTEGTFTISSLGSLGVREYTAIINPPEVGILAVGAAEKRAVVRGDAILARTMMTVTLSSDHRVVDGAVASEFLASLKAMLEQPAMMLL